MGATSHPSPPDGVSGPASSISRRQVLASGTVGIATLTLPAATAAASGEALTPASVSTLTFTEVTETSFTVSWS